MQWNVMISGRRLCSPLSFLFLLVSFMLLFIPVWTLFSTCFVSSISILFISLQTISVNELFMNEPNNEKKTTLECVDYGNSLNLWIHFFLKFSSFFFCWCVLCVKLKYFFSRHTLWIYVDSKTYVVVISFPVPLGVCVCPRSPSAVTPESETKVTWPLNCQHRSISGLFFVVVVVGCSRLKSMNCVHSSFRVTFIKI